MIKKLIASAALIAAGSALAGATVTFNGDGTVGISADTSGLASVSNFSAYGFVFTLDSDTYTNEDGYTLNSLSVVLGYNVSFTGYIAIYACSQANSSGLGTLTYVGYSEVTTSSGTIYDSSGGSYTRKTATGSSFTDGSGDDVILDTDRWYLVVFMDDSELASAADQTSFSTDMMTVLSLCTDTGDDNGLATLGSPISSANGYVNNTTVSVLAGATLTAVTSEVPEPSAFGLLAGVAALAFAASRRRRSRKAA